MARRGRTSRGGSRVSRTKLSRTTDTHTLTSPGQSIPTTPQPVADEAMEDMAEDTQPIEDAEEVGTPVNASEQDHDDSPAPSHTLSQQPQSIKRRPGRPPRIRGPDEGDGEDASEAGTPFKRRRGRPFGPRGGGRGRGRGRAGAQAAAQPSRVPVDKEGNMVDVVDDEVAMPEDEEGEARVNKNGELQGGRAYRVRTFTIKGRGKRLYMLSTEPARCTGFRDSYLFFTKHLTLFKIVIDDYEKMDLIDREVLPHSYKGRAIGVVTARSVFREFGSKIVIGGKKVTDDYYPEQARQNGDIEGELADPLDKLPAEGQPYNRNQYVAWHGASSVYHNQQLPGPMPNGKPIAGSKRKAAITSANWMFEHARAASQFNSSLTAARRETLNGVYDPHTNLMFLPKIMQPTHARWEQLETPMSPPKKRKIAMVNGDSHLSNGITNGDHGHDTTDQQQHSTQQSSHPFLAQPSSLLARNYLVVDTYFQTPPHATLPGPGPGSVIDSEDPAVGGGRQLPDLSSEDITSLPLECRNALGLAKQREDEWRRQWSHETKDGRRAQLKIGVGV